MTDAEGSRRRLPHLTAEEAEQKMALTTGSL